MDLRFIGIGGAFASELGCNCAYIKENENILFIDFGMDAFSKVIKHNLLENVEKVYIVLTHLHGDHIGGLFTFIDYCYFVKKIVVSILNNSSTFTNKLVKLLKLTGIQKSKFEIVENFGENFNFCLNFQKTTHFPMLECYSLIFEKENKKILYTSDTNDLNNVVDKINDKNFIKIYCEIGENSPVHLEYSDILPLKSEKLVLMHFQSVDLYNKAKIDGFNIPNYLK